MTEQLNRLVADQNLPRSQFTHVRVLARSGPPRDEKA
jgi:hypothetical protein